MEAILNYAIKAGIGLLVLYFFYFLVLRRQNSFRFNRFYLLVAPLLALRIPLMTWPSILTPDTLVKQALQTVQLKELTVTAFAPKAAEATASILPSLLLGLYLLGILLVFVKLAKQLWQINRLKSAARLTRQAEQVKVFKLDSFYPAFAFGRNIFLSRQQEQLSQQEQEQVMAHELAHVQFGHTWDVLYYEVLSAIFWFHPAIWLLKQELRDVHEYQADAAVLTRHEAQKYTSLLSREALLSMGLPVGSHFTKPQVLKRLQMLQQQGQKPGWLRPLLSLPVLAGLAFILARQQATAETQSITPESADVTASAETSSEVKPYTFVEQMPAFEGGDAAMMAFLGRNIRYPKQALEAGTEGLVVLSFIVEDDGSLHDIAVLKSLGGGTDEEAVRVVQLMDGKWRPGRQNGKAVPVRYTLPIRFATR